MTRNIEINGRIVGAGYPVYVIAEISANHNQNFENAIRIIQAAKEAGADAVKLQTYTPDTMTIHSDERYFKISGGTPWDGYTLYDLYSEAYMPWDWQPKLKEMANNLDLDLFSSAFDTTAVDFLEDMEVPIHKIASFEIVDIPLIEKMASHGKPLIISTGMATLGEIEEAVKAARGAGAHQIALLKCTSAYPASPEEMNLRTIPDLSEAFGVSVGLSDHTLGIEAPVAAIALGACIIEKHITISRSSPGRDSGFSLEPQEFKEMVKSIRNVEKALGRTHYGPSNCEAKSLFFRRSLFVVKNIREGEIFTKENIRAIRPGYGIHTKFLNYVIGSKAKFDIERGTPLKKSMVNWK